MKAPPSPTPAVSVAVQFRAEIQKAEAAGVASESMTLRLTMRDASRLKRDASLAITDISFAGGAMQFLGVKVQEGGVAVSVLELL